MRSKVIDKFLASFPPDWKERRKIEIKEYLEQLTADYQFGKYVGYEIINRFLPTLSIDMLKTRKVIKVSEAEENVVELLDKAWYKKRQNNELCDDEWNELRLAHKTIEDKYLPEKLECHLHILKIYDIKEFKNGLIDALWNCDCCHYNLEPDNIELTDDIDNLFTTITFIR
jgi:hypothetical protein